MITYHRPTIQNGKIARRGRRPVPESFSVAQGLSETLSTAAGVTGNTTTRVFKDATVRAERRPVVMPALIGGALLLASGFVYSLHQHFTATELVRQNVESKASLAQAKIEQRDLAVRYEQATSPEQLERLASEGGLAPGRRDPVPASASRQGSGMKAGKSPGSVRN